MLSSKLIEMCGNAVIVFDSHSVCNGTANLLIAQLSILRGDAS